MVVSHHVVAGNWTQDFWKNSQCSYPSEPSLQPYKVHFYKNILSLYSWGRGSLIYGVSSRTARATQRNPVSKTKQQQQQKFHPYERSPMYFASSINRINLTLITNDSSLDHWPEHCLPVNRTHYYDKGLRYFSIVGILQGNFAVAIPEALLWKLSCRDMTVLLCLNV